MSVKFRVQLCLARGGGFVGDALEECCRRAKASLESMTSFQNVSINPFVGRTGQGHDDEHEEQDQTPSPIPSFRQFQGLLFHFNSNLRIVFFGRSLIHGLQKSKINSCFLTMLHVAHSRVRIDVLFLIYFCADRFGLLNPHVNWGSLRAQRPLFPPQRISTNTIKLINS